MGQFTALPGVVIHFINAGVGHLQGVLHLITIICALSGELYAVPSLQYNSARR
jgi:hypothetical protein